MLVKVKLIEAFYLESEILTPYQFIIWDRIYELIVPWMNLGNHNLGVWFAMIEKQSIWLIREFSHFLKNKTQKSHSLHNTSKLPILNRLLSRLIMVKGCNSLSTKVKPWSSLRQTAITIENRKLLEQSQFSMNRPSMKPSRDRSSWLYQNEIWFLI